MSEQFQRDFDSPRPAEKRYFPESNNSEEEVSLNKIQTLINQHGLNFKIDSIPSELSSESNLEKALSDLNFALTRSESIEEKKYTLDRWVERHNGNHESGGQRLEPKDAENTSEQ